MSQVNDPSDPLLTDPFALRRFRRAGDVESVEQLARNQGAGIATRAAAIEALGRMNSGASLPLFESILQEEPWELRVSAARALGKLNDLSGEELLIATLDDEHVSVRSWAAERLGKIRSRRAVPRLLEALANDDWWVSASAARALSRIGDRRALGPLKEQHSKQKTLRGRRIFGRAVLRLRFTGSRAA